MPVSPHTPPASSSFKARFLRSMLSPRGLIGSWRAPTVGLLGQEICSLQERYLVNGSYGIIWAVREKATGKTWSCKSIDKAQIQGCEGEGDWQDVGVQEHWEGSDSGERDIEGGLTWVVWDHQGGQGEGDGEDVGVQEHWQGADSGCKRAVAAMRREVTVMQLLKGHAHVVEMKETVEDDTADVCRHPHVEELKQAVEELKQAVEELKQAVEELKQAVEECRDRDGTHVHIIMELCRGGDLFDRIKQRRRYEEAPAAAVLQQLALVLRACHSLGVMHRDVKPENLLLCSPHDDVAVKVTDFGIAATIKTGAKLTELIGSHTYMAPEAPLSTPFSSPSCSSALLPLATSLPGAKLTEFIGSHMYMAPEVINKSYSAEADVWSAGVVLYVLLAGVPPFWASTESGVLDAIVSKPLNFSFPPWPSISMEAKGLIKEMLKKEPAERITLDAVLGKWIFL
ncbi:unnamed protein product [Closterium sp. NIES-65]|nr:unnamed protein product [Closterium sp. NIES-65]